MVCPNAPHHGVQARSYSTRVPTPEHMIATTGTAPMWALIKAPDNA
jgi:hypothetical protein